jgi:hypothetical protein
MGAFRGQLKTVPLGLACVAAALGVCFFPSIAAGIIAGVLFILALLCLVEDRRLVHAGQRARATVVDFREEEDCFFPIVEFRDDGGATRREATKVGRGVRQPPVGREIIIVFDPTGRRGCEIDTFWRRRGMAVAFALLGAVFAAGAFLGK